MYVATSKQMKAYDQALLAEGYTIEGLVDKASDTILPHCMNYDKILIICGPGNNGADGLSLGTKLHLRGRKVKLYCFGNPEKLSPANNYYIDQAQEIGVSLTFLDDEEMPLFIKDAKRADVIVDAMFGFGLNCEVRGIAKMIINEINNLANAEVIAIDIPTGLNPDTGIPLGSVVCADKTITLTAIKQAFLNEECYMYTGEIIVELLDVADLRQEQGLARLISPSWIKRHLKKRDYYGYKGTYGKILEITGCDHYRGAALLAARAGVYSGSGIVCVYSTPAVINALTVSVPECTSLERVEALEKDVLSQYEAILIGSGLGRNEISERYLLDTLKEATTPVVIDGDALTMLASHLDCLNECEQPIILTPHFGEFKRLSQIDDELEMINQVRDFAFKYGVIVVLKGPNTIITDGTNVCRNITGNRAMATAGMGDVLAGMITSFLGQGYQPFIATILAVYLHGYCGDIIGNREYTVLPSKLINLIPKAMYEIINENKK